MRFFLFITITLSFLCSCSTTRIYVENPNVDIYVNNIHKGKGTVYIRKSGIPTRKTIVAKYKGKIIYTTDIRRRFSLATGLSGCFSYGIGWLVFWQFPEQINIPISDDLLQNILKNKQIPSSNWMQAPKVWN